MNRKTFFLALSAFALGYAPCVRAATRPFVYDTATKKAPSIDRLYRDFRLYVDTMPTARQTVPASDNKCKIHNWTDCEIKVIDKFGNLVYFTTTVFLFNAQIAALHPMITDKTPRIYYWRSAYTNATNGCWGYRAEFTDFAKSIGSKVGGDSVGAIWIYPSISSTETRAVPIYTARGVSTTKTVVWGDYVRETLTNPDNTVLAWRQTKTDGEESTNGSKVWRPVRIEYFGNFKVRE